MSGLGGTLSEYEITSEGRLRVRAHERERREDPESFGGGYLESVDEWWEDIPDVHGDIRIYTLESDERFEFRIRFTDGVVNRIEEVDRATSDQRGKVGSRSSLTRC